VIVESLRGLPPVNEESIIFKEDRQAAGKIFEIFGPVLHPFYVLRFNNSEHINAKGINVQDSMYFAPSVEDFTQYIFAEKLKQTTAICAFFKCVFFLSFNQALDFSDDEKEREAKQKKRKPQSQGRKKLKPETNALSENKGPHQSMQQPPSTYSRGYRGRGFSRDPFPPQSGPPFLRPQMRPPQLYSSDNRIHQESPGFPQSHRKENPMMQQYPFPPPVFGSVNEHQFHLPPSNLNMMWTGPNMYNSSYPFLPPPPPPPDSHPSHFRPY
ncbi:NAF1 protein, partial [Centropus bengalensis]|nr:NAF1 protein [Centropus bengalensis]